MLRQRKARGGVTAGSPPLADRLLDPLALAAYPVLAGALGYRFETGSSERLHRHGRAVLAEVWASEGLAPPPPEHKAISERYDAATTWIVAYAGGKPVGVLGLVDLRVVSVALDLFQRLPPPELALDKTIELARLAVLPAHRGRADTVLVGLLREMLVFCKQRGLETVFASAARPMYQFYRRFNPTARLIDPPPKPSEPEELTRYYQALREFDAGQGVLFVMDVGDCSAWPVFRQFVKRRFLRSTRR
jgi:GNAT superfamily N-acetyltransferase